MFGLQIGRCLEHMKCSLWHLQKCPVDELLQDLGTEKIVIAVSIFFLKMLLVPNVFQIKQLKRL